MGNDLRQYRLRLVTEEREFVRAMEKEKQRAHRPKGIIRCVVTVSCELERFCELPVARSVRILKFVAEKAPTT